MRIVVTGGAGYVGSALIPLLLRGGHDVLVYDSLLWGGHALLPHFLNPRFKFIEGDVRDAVAVRKALVGADAVVHLAALVGYPLCKKLPRDAMEVNVDGARNVVDNAPDDAFLVYASTGSNYGEVVGVCTEETPLNPLSLYGETKTSAEALFTARPRSASLRFATAFGLAPRLRLDLMINDFVWQALHRRHLVVYEKHFRRTFLHVTDIARAIQFALENKERLGFPVFNIGHESLNFTKQDICELIRRRVEFEVYYAEFGSDDDRRDYHVDYSRARAAGFESRVDIEAGLDELIRALPLVKVQNPYSNV
jgi:nucleoside-diphosphate-sugar epimerase